MVIVVNMDTEGNRQLWCKDYSIPSKTEAAHAVTDCVLEVLDDYAWGQRDIFAIHLSLEEALINAVRHGNRSNSKQNVSIHLEISPDRFLVSVADEGEGFDPDSLPEPTLDDCLERPCGRGVKLMRSFMTVVSFNESGNRVTLVKERSAPLESDSSSGQEQK